jgi:hypothetical protein
VSDQTPALAMFLRTVHLTLNIVIISSYQDYF